MSTRLLVVTPDQPSFKVSAGTKRLAHLIEALHFGHDITCATVGKNMPDDDVIKSCKSVRYVHFQSITDFISLVRSDKFDIVLFEYWRTGLTYAWLTRLLSPDSLLCVDCVDLEYLRLSRSAEYSKKHVIQTRREEIQLIEYCDAVICVSAREADIVKREMSVQSDLVTTFSVIYDIVRLERRPQPGILLFVGNGGHTPNFDAMIWFCNEVMPYVNPSVSLRLVGANWPESLNAKNVDVIGFVDDLVDEYVNCAYVVSPIRFGSGVNGKVAEAYCYGLPMIMSSLAADGCGIAQGDGLTILSTENANDWVQAIDRLVACETAAVVEVSEKVADQFSFAANAERLSEFTNLFKSLRGNRSRKWKITLLYAVRFLVSHLRHLTRQK